MGEEEWGLREESISGPVKRGSGKARPVMNHHSGVMGPKQLAL